MTKQASQNESANEKQANEKQSTLWDHLAELKMRLLICGVVFLIAFVGCYYYAEPIYRFLLKPLERYYAAQLGRRMIYTGLTEAFFTYVKLAVFGAFILTFPVWSMQLYRFIAPGLYKHERRVFLPYLTLAPLLFLLGSCLVYYLIFPTAWQFFLSFETIEGLPIQMEARVSEYLSLVIQLILAFGLAFQLPIVLTLLIRAELLSVAALKRKRRYAIVAMFSLAAILTPPDIFSMIGLAMPLLLLYECSIIAGQWIEKSRLKSQEVKNKAETQD